MDSVLVGLPMKGVPTGKLSAVSESESETQSHIILCDSSLIFHIMCSEYKLNKQGDNIQP